MGLELTVVDAFTERPFSGNPAAVAVVDAFPPPDYMQSVAREMNLSETAFVAPRNDGDHDLRWFSPAVEVDLCGHATLASAHVLGGFACFHTRSGSLSCSRSDDGWIEMDFPADPPSSARLSPPPALEGIRWSGRGRYDVLIELESAAAVRECAPDLGELAELRSRAVILTARGDRPGIDCVSRVFAPNFGIPEDPVTGSAHCTLAEYWGELTHRDELVGEQASPRGGIVRMRRQLGRVVLGGRAVTTASVHLRV